MRKGSNVIGLPVYTRVAGKEKESVKDIIFDHKTNRVLALVLDEGGWFSDARIIRWQDVKSIGPDAVIIRSEAVIANADEDEDVKKVLESGNVLQGTKLLTTDGQDLGQMADVFFSDVSGLVVGYEVSGGMFADAYTGRSYVPAPQTLTIGEDAAFVPPATAELMSEQVSGIKGALETAGKKAQDAAQSTTNQLQQASATAGEKLQQASATAGEKLQEAKVTASEKLQEAKVTASEKLDQASQAVDEHSTNIADTTSGMVDKRMAQYGVEAAKGRRAHRSIQLETGAYLVVVGQIVTDAIVERAKETNHEHDLLAAVGLDTTTAAQSKSSDMAGETGEKVKEGAQNLWQSVKETADAAKTKLEEAQEKSQEVYEQQRIDNALGKPVNRVILDKSDNVILDVGDLITHEAVERARKADVLNILLNSVYQKEPTLSEDALRANSKA